MSLAAEPESVVIPLRMICQKLSNQWPTNVCLSSPGFGLVSLFFRLDAVRWIYR